MNTHSAIAAEEEFLIILNRSEANLPDRKIVGEHLETEIGRKMSFRAKWGISGCCEIIMRPPRRLLLVATFPSGVCITIYFQGKKKRKGKKMRESENLLKGLCQGKEGKIEGMARKNQWRKAGSLRSRGPQR